MEPKKAILRTETLIKSYTMGENVVNAVNRVSMKVFHREFCAIVGPSGSGKSTLLHLLGGIDEPSGGEVWYEPEYESEGKPVSLYALSPSRLAKFRGKTFGFVFQNYALLPVLTAWENVRLPSVYNKVSFDKKYARELFGRLGLADRADHLPSELSGGEQQRVAVIRAMVSQPRVLFADEPTGNLDSKTGEELIRLLDDLRRESGTTVVMVTHDLALAERCDRMIRIEDGEIVRVDENRTPDPRRP